MSSGEASSNCFFASLFSLMRLTTNAMIAHNAKNETTPINQTKSRLLTMAINIIKVRKYEKKRIEKISSYINPPISYIFAIICDFLFPPSYYLCLAMLKKYLVISTSNDLVRIAPEKIVYISSDGNYCNLVQSDNETRLLSFQLGQIETMIHDQLGTGGNQFIRIGRSHIINRNYIYYINIQNQKLILSDVTRFTHTVSASKEALKQLKELIEKEAEE